MSIVDVVPVRRGKNGDIEVLLTQRDAGDPYWPGMWHNPGTVVLASDEQDDYADALNRILVGELGLPGAQEPHFVTSLLHRTRRGSESTRIYWIELSEQPRNGTFFSVSRLPKGTIEPHVELIRMAVRDFEESM